MCHLISHIWESLSYETNKNNAQRNAAIAAVHNVFFRNIYFLKIENICPSKQVQWYLPKKILTRGKLV